MTGIFRLVLSLTILKGVLEFKCKISPSLGGDSVNQLETQAFTAHRFPHLLGDIVIFIVLYIKQASPRSCLFPGKLDHVLRVKRSPGKFANRQRCRTRKQTQKHINQCLSPAIKNYPIRGNMVIYEDYSSKPLGFSHAPKKHPIKSSTTLVFMFPSIQMCRMLWQQTANRLKGWWFMKPACLEKQVSLN